MRLMGKYTPSLGCLGERLEGKGKFRERVLLLIFASYKMGEKTLRVK